MSMSAFDKQRWGVRICGPDTILAAASFKEAAHYCNRINTAIQSMAEYGYFDGENMPVIFAQIDTWAQIAGDTPQDPENTDWSRIE